MKVADHAIQVGLDVFGRQAIRVNVPIVFRNDILPFVYKLIVPVVATATDQTTHPVQGGTKVHDPPHVPLARIHHARIVHRVPPSFQLIIFRPGPFVRQQRILKRTVSRANERAYNPLFKRPRIVPAQTIMPHGLAGLPETRLVTKRQERGNLNHDPVLIYQGIVVVLREAPEVHHGLQHTPKQQ